jgi:hypothetical protein
MPNDLLVQNELTLRAGISQGINLFAGAGFSILAKDQHGQNLPVGTSLRDELMQHFKMGSANRLDLSQVCAILEATQLDGFQSYLKERFSVKSFDTKYNILGTLPIKTIFTTNIDSLFHTVYEGSDDYYLNDVDITGPAFSDRSAVDYIALHGCVMHPSPRYVFNQMELAAAFSSDPDKWRMLTQRLQRFPTLFCGYGLSDAGVLQALSPTSTKGRPHQDKWIELRFLWQGRQEIIPVFDRPGGCSPDTRFPCPRRYRSGQFGIFIVVHHQLGTTSSQTNYIELATTPRSWRRSTHGGQ